jgi:hypothetical protein
MAVGKEFFTRFNIGAKFTGAAEVNKATSALQRTEKAAQRAHAKLSMMGKVAGAALGGAAVYAATKITASLIDLGKAAYNAAEEVAKTHEQNKLMLQSFGMNAAAAAKVEKKLYDLADAMEKSNKKGHDAELMSTVFSGVAKSVPTAQIQEYADAISGYVTKLGGVSPTSQDAQKAQDDLNLAVKKGRGDLLVQLGYNKDQIAVLGKLSEERRREVILMKMQQKFGSLTAAAYATDSGKMAYAATQFENVLEELGAPLLEHKGAIGDMLTSIAIQLQEVAHQVGEWLAPRIKELLSYLSTNMPQIIAEAQRWWEQIKIVWEWVMKLEPAFRALQAFGKEFFEVWKVSWQTVIDLIANTKKEIDEIVTWFWWFYGELKKVFESIYETIVGAFKRAWEDAKKFIPSWMLPAGAGGTTALSPQAIQRAQEVAPWGAPPAAQPPPATTTAGQQAAQLASRGGYGAGQIAAQAAVAPALRGQSMGQFYGTQATAPMPAAPITAAAVRPTEATKGGQLYEKLLAQFRAHPPKGIPPDAAQFGITKGTPEEWARMGVSIAHAESGFNPRSRNLTDPGGSFGVFQYAHGQAYGNAYDVDKSVSAYVRDVNAAAVDPKGLHGSILGRRFSTIGRHPAVGARYLGQAETIARQVTPTTSLPSTIQGVSPGATSGGSTTTLSTNAPITVNGVDPSNAAQVGAEVARKIKERDENMLSSLRKARDEESRLAYV